jgi:MFS transporter, AAHS family, 4-hydroxybenzoate transporter
MLPAMVIACCVTVLDGFDSMSLSLVAPLLAKDWRIDISAFGFVFASQMAGMMLGSLAGGAAADRIGRKPMLMLSLALFAAAAFVMPITKLPILIGVNRLIAGIGLGAAAPIAVALVARSATWRASNALIGTIWAGLPLGGIIAAGFNYFVISRLGWQSIFIAGAIAPILIGALALLVLPSHAWLVAKSEVKSLVFKRLFASVARARLGSLGLVFIFGYATMAIIVFWLPTILHLRGGSTLFVSLAFMSLNIGSSVGSIGIGLIADRTQSRAAMLCTWIFTGLCLVCMEALAITPLAYFCVATAAATLAAGAIAIAVATASRSLPGMESTSVGLMVTLGRIGQVGALALTGVIAASHIGTRGIFLFAGLSAFAAALSGLAVAASPKSGVAAAQTMA